MNAFAVITRNENLCSVLGLKNLKVVTFVTGNDVGDCPDREFSSTRDAPTLPGVPFQMLKEVEVRPPDTLELAR